MPPDCEIILPRPLFSRHSALSLRFARSIELKLKEKQKNVEKEPVRKIGEKKKKRLTVKTGCGLNSKKTVEWISPLIGRSNLFILLEPCSSPPGYGCLLRAHRLHFVSSAADIPKQLLSFIIFILVFKGSELRRSNNNNKKNLVRNVQLPGAEPRVDN